MNLDELKKYNIFKKNEDIIGIELLKSQGYNNISYLLKTKSKNYVLRVFKSNESVNESRKFEFQIQTIAYKKGFGAKPVFLNESFMIYEYIKGFHKTKLSKENIKSIAKILKKLHSVKVKHKVKHKTKNYELEAAFLKYEKELKDEKSLALIIEAKKALQKLKKFKKDLVLTHHDLNPKNIIFNDNNKNIKIIDWEYAGKNDSFFDLASICIEFNFTKKDERVFLKSYFKNQKKLQKKDFEKLKQFKIIYKNLCALWFKSVDKAI